MKKSLSIALLALSLPAAASAASINLGTTVVGVNKTVGISARPVYASSATPMIAALQCPFGGCTGNPAPCQNSPENPTALLGVLGATGLLLGRLGYGRLRNRSALASPTAA